MKVESTGEYKIYESKYIKVTFGSKWKETIRPRRFELYIYIFGITLIGLSLTKFQKTIEIPGFSLIARSKVLREHDPIFTRKWRSSNTPWWTGALLMLNRFPLLGLWYVNSFLSAAFLGFWISMEVKRH